MNSFVGKVYWRWVYGVNLIIIGFTLYKKKRKEKPPPCQWDGIDKPCKKALRQGGYFRLITTSWSQTISQLHGDIDCHILSRTQVKYFSEKIIIKIKLLFLASPINLQFSGRFEVLGFVDSMFFNFFLTL